LSTDFSEAAARMAVFDWCRDLSLRCGEVIPRAELQKGVPFAAATGGVIRVMGPQGIFTPKDFQFPLSITTSPDSPYNDAFSPGGYLRYKYRGTNPNHPDNVGLRRASARHLPLIYFHGVLPGRYLASWPVFIHGEDPTALEFTVAVDDRLANTEQPTEDLEAALRRRYTTTLVRRRIHQQAFRARVVVAYRNQCAMCRLRHEELLDAAHIVPDREEGEPMVSNGLALCKLHHAAFDNFLVSVTPDFGIQVRASILEEEDGPVLEHGLKKLQGVAIHLPRRTGEWPDPDALAQHHERFLVTA